MFWSAGIKQRRHVLRLGGGVDRAQAVSRVWGVSAPCPGGRRGARARPTLLAALIIIIIIIIILRKTCLFGGFNIFVHLQNLACPSVSAKNYVFYGSRRKVGRIGSIAPSTDEPRRQV